jgi:hypothetical protein
VDQALQRLMLKLYKEKEYYPQKDKDTKLNLKNLLQKSLWKINCKKNHPLIWNLKLLQNLKELRMPK